MAPTDMLYLAVTRHNSQAAESVLRNGYDDIERPIRIGDRLTATALVVAVMNEDLDMVNILLTYGANIHAEHLWYQNSKSSVLTVCATQFHRTNDVAKILITAGVDVNFSNPVNSYQETALVRAILTNNFKLAKLLLDNGASISYEAPVFPRVNGLKELLLSTLPGKLMHRSLEFLTSNTIEKLPFVVNRDLKLSVFHTFFNITELSHRHADPDAVTAIFNLLRHQFPDPQLLEVTDIFGATALHYAVHKANVHAVRLLLQAGAKTDVRATLQAEELRFILRKEIIKRMVEGGEDWNENELEGVIDKCTIELTPVYGEKTPVEMAREGIFADIPQFIQDDPYELEKFAQRRNDIREIQ